MHKYSSYKNLSASKGIGRSGVSCWWQFATSPLDATKISKLLLLSNFSIFMRKQYIY